VIRCYLLESSVATQPLNCWPACFIRIQKESYQPLLAELRLKSSITQRIPHPLAMRSFFEKLAAIEAAANNAFGPNVSSRLVRALSEATRSKPIKASEEMSNFLPPGTPIADRFVTNVDAAFMNQIFNIVKRKGKPTYIITARRIISGDV
jgi:hypothetical protein